MVNKNDFRLLKQKCMKEFENASAICNFDNTEISDIQKERFGFYFLMLQQITNISEYEEISEMITDTDYNRTFFNNRDSDEGIDAVYIDNENSKILLFNFKYREDFNPDSNQSLNEALLTSKFLNVLNTENNNLKGNLFEHATDIISCLNSSIDWSIVLYYVTNEAKPLQSNNNTIVNFAETYGIIFESISLSQIKEYITLSPKNIDATLSLNTDALMTFSENQITTDKSYIIRLTLSELIRITCNNPEIRNDYNLENESELPNTTIAIDVLFENVRGFIMRSKFNENIEQSLEKEPSKFFYYNNGITIVTSDIKTKLYNNNKKCKIEIKNFQVLNGGQTLRTIHRFYNNNSKNINEEVLNAEILVRILNVSDEELRNKIGQFTNSQNTIKNSDLKSNNQEQLQLESFLAANNIQYLRKKDNIQKNKYSIAIGKQKLGQILLAISGKPEETSNKKKLIFEDYYERLFSKNESLLSKETVRIINNYETIKKQYKIGDFNGSEQKYMYILYLTSRNDSLEINDIIQEFETFILAHREEKYQDISIARMLINSKFKNSLDEYFSNIKKV